MDGVPIKFRGRRRNDGRYTYAEIIVDAEGVYQINDADGGHTWKVEPDTIHQLIGYDKDGNEVYDGDEVIVDGEYCSEVWAEMVVRDAPFYWKSIALKKEGD